MLFEVFRQCVSAIKDGILIERASAQDKEFHFQNWFRSRLASLTPNFERGGRNSYPDFRLVDHAEGFEVKGLAYPGRERNYDCNSQVPSGLHNGRSICYVFGRYPHQPDGNEYPVLDFVMCHGDFLNIDHEYVHQNKSVRGFGSFGDIMIRDRKMYVAPTPFGLVDGLAHQQTLILPANQTAPAGFHALGRLVRREATHLIVGYSFDLRTNKLKTRTVPNPNVGREHIFSAYRLTSGNADRVAMHTGTLNIDDETDH